MDLSRGGVQRALIVITTTFAVSVGLAACSSDEKSPEPTPTSSATTTDPAAADQEAVEQVTKDYWAALVKAQNSGDDDPAPLLEVAAPKIVEGKITEVKRYQDLNLLRVGKPVIKDIEVDVNGDTATIMLCKNEDPWTAEVDGQPVSVGKKNGSMPWGATATKADGRWKLSELELPPEGAKTC